MRRVEQDQRRHRELILQDRWVDVVQDSDHAPRRKRCGRADLRSVTCTRHMYEVEVLAEEDHFRLGTILEGELVLAELDHKVMLFLVCGLCEGREEKKTCM